MVDKRGKKLPKSRKERQAIQDFFDGHQRTRSTDRTPEFWAQQRARGRRMWQLYERRMVRQRQYDEYQQQQEKLVRERIVRDYWEQRRNLDGLAQVGQQLGSLSLQPGDDQRSCDAHPAESDGVSADGSLEPNDSCSRRGGRANGVSRMLQQDQDREGVDPSDKSTMDAEADEKHEVHGTDEMHWTVYQDRFRTFWLDQLAWPPIPPPSSNPAPSSPSASYPTAADSDHDNPPVPTSQFVEGTMPDFTTTSRSSMNRLATSPRGMPSSGDPEPNPATTAQSQAQQDATMRELGDRLARTRLSETNQSIGVRKVTSRSRRNHHLRPMALPRERAPRADKEKSDRLFRQFDRPQR